MTCNCANCCRLRAQGKLPARYSPAAVKCFWCGEKSVERDGDDWVCQNPDCRAYGPDPDRLQLPVTHRLFLDSDQGPK